MKKLLNVPIDALYNLCGRRSPAVAPSWFWGGLQCLLAPVSDWLDPIPGVSERGKG